MRVYKPIVAVLISSFIAVIFSGCYQDTSFVLSEDTVPSELTEVNIPQLLLDYCGVTAEDQLIAFGESIDRSERAEQVIVNSDGSLSYFCTDRQISNNIHRYASFLQEETERINSNFADYLVINDNYTEMIIRVNDFETYNNIFNILPLGCICGYIQIFSHPENPEWQLRITIINTNTDIVGCECTIPDEVLYIDCQQFFEDTNDIETYNSDESAHNVIITTGDLSAVSTAPTVEISTYETWVPDEDLTEVLLPSSLLSVAGTSASQIISSFYDPNISTPFFSEGALSNEDESLSFYCTQAEIEETLDNLESHIQDRVNSANGNLVDSIEISEDYSEITIEVSDVQSFEDMFSLHDVWVYCAAQQLFSHPDDPEWHLHLIMVNSQTGTIGYECTLPDEDLNTNSIDFFNNSSI